MRRLIERYRLRRDDEGFTLVELIVTVAIVGIIVTALTGIVISYLKTTVATQTRLTESQDVQLVSSYWQRDVASIGVRGYDAGTKTFPFQQSVDVAPACALPSGTTVATLAWSKYTSLDSTAAPTTVSVSYVAQPDAGRFTLFRVRCDGATQTSQIRVARNLDAVPVKACDVACTGAPNVPEVITLQLSVRDRDSNTMDTFSATLTGERRQT